METMDLTALTRRRSISRLDDPGPSRADLADMIEIACTAPDHGKLRPWRFIVLRGSARADLGDAFARAQSDRTPDAGPDEIDRAAGKALRSPVIVIVVGRVTPHPKVEPWEQLVAAGCAAHNLCVAATAHGFGSMWRTGWLAGHARVHAHLGLATDENIVGFVHLGTTPDDYRPAPREVDASCVEWLD